MRLDCSAAYYLLTATDNYVIHIILSFPRGQIGLSKLSRIMHGQAYLQLENGINLGGGKYEEKFTQENPW